MWKMTFTSGYNIRETRDFIQSEFLFILEILIRKQLNAGEIVGKM